MSLPCLYTTVQNTTGQSTYFGFLPPHGATLAADAQYSVAGDLVTRMVLTGGKMRAFQSFETALDAVKLVVVKTPAVHLYDATTEMVKVLSLNNNALGIVHPCWGWFSEPDNATP